MGQPNRLYEMQIQPYLVAKPFNIWALEFVGPINLPLKKKVYISVCIDYITKCVEATTLVRDIDQVVVDFLF